MFTLNEGGRHGMHWYECIYRSNTFGLTHRRNQCTLQSKALMRHRCSDKTLVGVGTTDCSNDIICCSPPRDDDDDVADSHYPASFPPALIAHCRRGGVSARVFRDWMAHGTDTHVPCRYIRIHPHHRHRLLLEDSEYTIARTPPLCMRTTEKAADGCVYSVQEHTEEIAALRRTIAARLSMPLSHIQPVTWLPCDCFALTRTTVQQDSSKTTSHDSRTAPSTRCYYTSQNSTSESDLPDISLTTTATRTAAEASVAGVGIATNTGTHTPSKPQSWLRKDWLSAMDAASMAAVVALRPRVGDRVLDLCCAPGNKMNLIADAVCPDNITVPASTRVGTISAVNQSTAASAAEVSLTDLKQSASSASLSTATEPDVQRNGDAGVVVGVDCSLPRLCVARALIRGHNRHLTGCAIQTSAGKSSSLAGSGGGMSSLSCALFCADGRSFTLRKGLAALRRRWLWRVSGDKHCRPCRMSRRAATVRDTGSGLTAAEEHLLRRWMMEKKKAAQSSICASALKRSCEDVCRSHGKSFAQGAENKEAEDDDEVLVVYAPTAVRQRLCVVNRSSSRNTSTTRRAHDNNRHGNADDTADDTCHCTLDGNTDDGEYEDMLFDRVLVDAECTHDGSLAHLHLDDHDAHDDEREMDAEDGRHTQRAKNAMTAAPRQCHGRGGLSNAYRMQHMHTHEKGATDDDGASLFELQLGLLMNGYAQLRVGGTLVYSTCSFSSRQNEDVVRAFLQRVNNDNSGSTCGSNNGGDGCDPEEHEMQDARSVAQVVPAFSYAHERHRQRTLAPCMTTVLDHLTENNSNDSTNYLKEANDVVIRETTSEELGVCSFVGLQRRLDRCRRMYDDTSMPARTPLGEMGSVEMPSETLGSRFWPQEFNTSFQYIVKIVKQPVYD